MIGGEGVIGGEGERVCVGGGWGSVGDKISSCLEDVSR